MPRLAADSCNARYTASPQASEKPMYATVFTPRLTMLAVSESTIRSMPCATTNIHSARSGLTTMGASDSCGVRASRATSVTAIEVGTLLGPMMASTLFSVTSLRAVLTAEEGSVASSRAMYSTALPPSVLGRSGTVLRYSEPMEAPGPVLLAITPMRMSARAALGARAQASASAARRRYMAIPLFWIWPG